MFPTTALRSLAIAAVVAAASVSAPAFAQSADTTQTVRVDLSDLNLGHVAGREAAERRIHRAAEEVCGGAPDSHDVRGRDRYDACLQTSQRSAFTTLARLSTVELASADAAAKRPSR